LLGLAVLFHQQQLDDWAVPSVGLLVTAAAIWSILRPTSLARLVTLMGLHLTSVLIDLPSVVNHWLMLGIAEMGILIAVAIGLVRRSPWVTSSGLFYNRVAPTLRIQLLIVYVAASFAKFNTDFLDPAVSCGVAMVDQLMTFGPLRLSGDWLHRPAIVGALAVECMLAVGLAWRRTRNAALFLGLGFHLTLAFAGHVPFSGFAIAFYSLFAPDDLLLRSRTLLARWRPLNAGISAMCRVGSGPVGLVAAFSMLAALTLLLQAEPARSLVRQAFVASFLVYNIIIIVWLMLVTRVTGAPVYRPGALRLSSGIWLIGPVLIVLNAISPYAGLKTQSTFTMYSNLQTEGRHWNHLLLSEEVQVFDVQDHLVRIVHSSDPAMAEAAREGRAWVWTALQGWARRNPSASLTYEDESGVHSVPRVGADARLRSDRIEAMLAQFRDVPSGAGNYCRTERRNAGDQHS